MDAAFNWKGQQDNPCQLIAIRRDVCNSGTLEKDAKREYDGRI